MPFHSLAKGKILYFWPLLNLKRDLAMDWIVSGIQQIGVGVRDAEAGFRWYRKHFGLDVPVFKDAGRAELMTRYTSGKAEDRYAILAINMQGGGGLEIWQYTSKVSVKQPFQPALGDTGIFAAKIKAVDVAKAFEAFSKEGITVSKHVTTGPDGKKNFLVRDPDGNLFQIVEGEDWFNLNGKLTGGICGCIIGVSDIDKSIDLYKKVLGSSSVIYDVTDDGAGLSDVKQGGGKVRRVLIASGKERIGPFGRLMGRAFVELVQVSDRTPRKIFGGRNWGDMGFIHVCFDVREMKKLGAGLASVGHPFTVDSAESFDMGKAAGHFTYVEDRDGTLVEFVETHKVPVLAKLGIYLNLKNRDPKKPLPDWMVRTMGFNRVKD
jgi:catechol 2,3-dioxygenase-like lactoylglutathione lyase family enzyme